MVYDFLTFIPMYLNATSQYYYDDDIKMIDIS